MTHESYEAVFVVQVCGTTSTGMTEASWCREPHVSCNPEALNRRAPQAPMIARALWSRGRHPARAQWGSPRARARRAGSCAHSRGARSRGSQLHLTRAQASNPLAQCHARTRGRMRPRRTLELGEADLQALGCGLVNSGASSSAGFLSHVAAFETRNVRLVSRRAQAAGPACRACRYCKVHPRRGERVRVAVAHGAPRQSATMIASICLW